MANVKLSDRASILLALIIDYTKRDDCGRMERYWVPYARRQRSRTLDGYVYVGGSGDAAAIRALCAHGFIKKERVHAYAASATEDGILHFERNIVEIGRLEDLRRIVARHNAIMDGRGASALSPHPNSEAQAAGLVHPEDE